VMFLPLVAEALTGTVPISCTEFRLVLVCPTPFSFTRRRGGFSYGDGIFCACTTDGHLQLLKKPSFPVGGSVPLFFLVWRVFFVLFYKDGSS